MTLQRVPTGDEALREFCKRVLGLKNSTADLGSLMSRAFGAGKFDPFDFPHSGRKLPVRPSTWVQYLDYTADDSRTILEAEGDGVVRLIHIAPAGTSPSTGAMQSFWLDVFYGGEETPSLSAPLGDFVGAYVFPELEQVARFDTPLFSLMHCDPGFGRYGIALKYPIPYTDGIKICIRDHDTVGGFFYATVRGQSGLPACWNRGYKLKNVRTTGTVNGPAAGAGTITSVGTAVTCSDAAGFANVAVGDCIIDATLFGEREVVAKADNSHVTVEYAWDTDLEAATWKYGKNREFLNLEAGKSGVIVACTAGFVPASASQYYLENNPHFHVNGDAERSDEWAGTEDYFGGVYYYEGIDMRQDWGGVVYRDETAKSYGVYHNHIYDPVFFSNGIKGHWCNEFCGGDGDAPNTDVTWACFYYEDE
jgi:hypothetical protein